MSNARKLADNLPTEGSLSGRNVVVNGEMKVAQRGTSSTGLGTASAYYTADRWKTLVGGDATAGRLTMSQETTDVPSGFTHAMKLACTTADTSIAANELFGIVQHIEAGTCARSQFGTSDAKEITVSFYAKADSNKTYSVMVLNNKNSSFVHNNRTFNVTTSWQRFTMTFQADTSADSKFDGTLTDAGFSLSFLLHAGSGYTSATLASDWASGVTNRAAGTQSIFSATSNTFFLTGVQLEVGPQSTPFEHEPVGVTLSKAQRYYYAHISAGSGTKYIGMGDMWTSTQLDLEVNLPVPMRTTPTLVATSGTNYYRGYGSGSGGGYVSGAWSLWLVSNSNTTVSQYATSGNMTQGIAMRVITNNTSAAIAYDAEF